jgi:hypothetical protein
MNREYLDTVRRAHAVLSKIPGVFAVGVGHKITGGVDTGRLALNVMVREKKPLASLAPDEVIPLEIEGLPTDVEQGQPPSRIAVDTFCRDFHPGVPPDLEEHRPFVGGIRIRAQSSQDFERRPSFGTLGCFATSTGDKAGKKVLLTNYHVLEDAFHEIHGPSCTGCTRGDAVGNPDVGGTAGHVLRGLDNDQLDAAIVLLDDGVQFQQEIIRDDIPAGSEALKGARPPLNPNDPADHNFAVHKRGHTTRTTHGSVRVFGFAVDVNEPGRARHKENQIRIDLVNKIQQVTAISIQANTVSVPAVDFAAANIQKNDLLWIEGALILGPLRITDVRQHEVDVEGTVANTPSTNLALFVTPPHFALHGDSGSVLVDDQSRVVGLIWTADCRVRFGSAWANPIDQVESQLKIKIDVATALGQVVTARVGEDPAAGGAAVAREGIERPAAAARGAEPVVTLRERVAQDLLPLARGRQIYDLYFKHHMEVRELIDTNRRVATVWHRQGGPGMIQTVLDAVRSRTLAIPDSIRGKSWGERVAGILAIFEKYGSARLREDIVRFGRDVEGLGGMTYPGFLESLKA